MEEDGADRYIEDDEDLAESLFNGNCTFYVSCVLWTMHL